MKMWRLALGRKWLGLEFVMARAAAPVMQFALNAPAQPRHIIILPGRVSRAYELWIVRFRFWPKVAMRRNLAVS